MAHSYNTWDYFKDDKSYSSECIFPFKYYGYTFTACTSADKPGNSYESAITSVGTYQLGDFSTFATCWCPTALNSNGDYVDNSAHGTDGQWKSCSYIGTDGVQVPPDE